MPTSWYYLREGTQYGPVALEEIKGLISSGHLRPDTPVWHEGMAAWAAADTMPEFADAAPPPPPRVSAGDATGPGGHVPEADDVERNKVFGVLAYLPPFLFLVPLLAARESKFAMYHCNQGLVLTLAALAGWVLLALVNPGFMYLQAVGWLLLSLLHLALFVGSVVLAVIGIVNAARGTCRPLPFIGSRFTFVK